MYRALQILKNRKVSFKIHVVGQRFRQIPPVFGEMHQSLADRIGYWGFIDSVDEYRSLLQKSDVVLSTAIHDFQGIAVLEAVAAGCVPLVPDRLAYPELFAKRFRYSSIESDIEKEAEILAERLELMGRAKEQGKSLIAPDIKGLGWKALRPFYQRWINSLTVMRSKKYRLPLTRQLYIDFKDGAAILRVQLDVDAFLLNLNVLLYYLKNIPLHSWQKITPTPTAPFMGYYDLQPFLGNRGAVVFFA